MTYEAYWAYMTNWLKLPEWHGGWGNTRLTTMLELQGKPDAQAALDRFEAWWVCENDDRPVLTISVPPPHPEKLPTKRYDTAEEAWFDFDFRIERALAEVEQGVYVAETFPSFEPNLGPDVLSTLYGLSLEFASSTSWGVPTLQHAGQILEIEPNFTAREWQGVSDLVHLGLEAGKGKWITLFTDLHGNADVLSALLGPETACTEFLDDPETVKNAIEHVTLGCREAYRRQIAPIQAEGLPVSCWMGAYHQGPTYAAQADFTAMISRDLFHDAVLPSVIAEMSEAERVIYHLDGEDALRHLDVLLEVPQIHAIQWVYGAGHGPAIKWEPIYRRILEAGKGIKVECETITDALALHERLGNKGVWYNTGAPNREEAERLVAEFS